MVAYFGILSMKFSSFGIILIILVGNVLHAQDCELDTIPPVVICNDFTASYVLSQNTPKFAISIKSLIESVSDNCTLEDDIVLSFDSTQSARNYFVSCDRIGRIDTVIYATDLAGNTSVCTVRFNVVDGDFVCNPKIDFEIQAKITNDTLESFPPFDIALKKADGTFEKIEPKEIIREDGSLMINLFDGDSPFPSDAEIEINFIPDTTNYDFGVSTLDVVFVIKHLLGIDPFDKPEQFIAADVNGDGKVSAVDVIEIRKLLLGIEDRFSGGKSRVILPEKWSIPVDQLSNQSDANFLSVKIGDVNVL